MVNNLQFFAIIPATIPIIFLVTFSFMPESPLYLTSRGLIKEARASLQWFRGKNYDVEDEITKTIYQIAEDQKNKAHIADLVQSRAASKGLMISLGLMAFQQISGINAVIFYAEKIFEKTGSGLPSYIIPIILGVVMVLATYASTILIDKAGRRILLLISSGVMTLCLGSLAAYFYLQEMTVNLTLHFSVPVISVAIYITVFSLGFGPIPWMMLGELFPTKLKGIASSLAASFNWVLAFTVTKLFQNMLDVLGSGLTFGLFALSTMLATVFVCLMVPETKGKDIDEIQKMLSGGDNDYIKAPVTDEEDEEMNDVIVIDIKK